MRRFLAVLTISCVVLVRSGIAIAGHTPRHRKHHSGGRPAHFDGSAIAETAAAVIAIVQAMRSGSIGCEAVCYPPPPPPGEPGW